LGIDGGFVLFVGLFGISEELLSVIFFFFLIDELFLEGVEFAHEFILFLEKCSFPAPEGVFVFVEVVQLVLLE
jgi:hypothetical protein